MGTTYNEFKSAGICETLLNYSKNQTTFYYKYHYIYPKRTLINIWEAEFLRKNPGQPLPTARFEARWSKNYQIDYPNQNDLEDFLKATNDESRLKKADIYSSDVLNISDLRKATYFRDAIMRKELSADLDYAKQRDHAAHTLYNYLLGWYFYDYSKAIRLSIDNQIDKRDIFLDEDPEINKIKAFGTVWTYASLLHDIGYLLEGSLSNLSSDVEVAHVSRGAATIHDYFNHYFWKDIDLDFHSARDVARHLNLYVPDFKSVRSIAALSDNLSVFGDCEPIRLSMKIEISELERFEPPRLKGSFNNKNFDKTNRLDIDSFKLWSLHYRVYDNRESNELINKISIIFKELVWEGLPQSNSRTINHGVSSGLLGLMFSTFYYQILHGINNIETYNKKLSTTLNNLREEIHNLNPINQDGRSNIQAEIFNQTMADLKKLCLQGQQFSMIDQKIGLMGLIAKLSFHLRRDREINEEQYFEIETLRSELQGLAYSEMMTYFNQYNFNSVKDFILKKTDIKPFPYLALNWFSLSLWGTGAAAVHDIVQNSKIWENPKFSPFIRTLKRRRNGDGILSLQESPLEYLGVLVDILQEWDRYSVRKDEVFATKDRLQGTQVDLVPIKSNKDRLHLTFKNVDLQNDMVKALTFSLVDWKKYVRINNFR